MSEKKALIALIDDDADFIEINRRMLARLGYEVQCFSDAAEALAGMRKRKPDLAVTDLMMDELDSGFSMIRRIRADETLRRIPVIILSGIASQRGYNFAPENSADLSAMGADAFMQKPVKSAPLQAKIEELLRQSREPAQ